MSKCVSVLCVSFTIIITCELSILDIDECELGLAGCHNNATCLDTAGRFQCDCIDGYEGDGFNCSSIC